MKVNTDGCLLGAWASADAPTTILDIGAGSGLVGLMLAQRYPNATVDLVEIEPHCAEQCAENVRESPFAHRVNTHIMAIQDFSAEKRYDLIVSNPPYFENHLLSPDEKRKLARHNTALTLEALVAVARRMLTDKGTFCVILPENRKTELVKASRNAGLLLQTQIAIRSLPKKPISRYLLAFNREVSNPESAETNIENVPGTYSEIVKKWFSPFYLNL
jgi:tRNA1Val (adenine37-N6)-methyltransferase